MADSYPFSDGGIAGPAGNAAAVTPSNSTALDFTSRALWVGGAGDIACLMRNGQTVTFAGVSAGTLLPLRVQRVNATNTTATNIVAIW